MIDLMPLLKDIGDVIFLRINMGNFKTIVKVGLVTDLVIVLTITFDYD